MFLDDDGLSQEIGGRRLAFNLVQNEALGFGVPGRIGRLPCTVKEPTEKFLFIGIHFHSPPFRGSMISIQIHGI
jgi:hypothetical protein